MKKYPFFSRIGAFSIDRKNIKSALYSLDFSGKWLEGTHNSLFLYPEGKITDSCSGLELESGFTRIIRNYKGFDIVLISLYISYKNYDKPELFIGVSQPILPDPDGDRASLKNEISARMQRQLDELRESSSRQPELFSKLV